jgi:hypothetical protein
MFAFKYRLFGTPAARSKATLPLSGWIATVLLPDLVDKDVRPDERIVNPRGGEAWNDYVQETGPGLHHHAWGGKALVGGLG